MGEWCISLCCTQTPAHQLQAEREEKGGRTNSLRSLRHTQTKLQHIYRQLAFILCYLFILRMFWSVLCMPYSLQHLFSDTEKKKKSVASDHTASISYLDHSVSNPHWPSAWPSPICTKMLWHKIWTYIMIAVKFYLHIPKGFPDTFFGITFHWHAFMPFLLHAEMCSLINKYGCAFDIWS